MSHAIPALDGIDLERLRPLVCALLDDPSAADDVLQETWLAARRGLPQHLHGAGQLESWLRTTARRIASRLRRRDAARHTREKGVALREGAATRPEEGPVDEHLERLEALSLVLAALAALAEPYRSTLALRYVDGLQPGAIARKLGRDPALVRQHLHRGLARLREELDRRAGGRRTWALPLILGWQARHAPLAAAAAALVLVGSLAFTAFVVTRPDNGRSDIGPAAAPATVRSAPAAAGGIADLAPPDERATRVGIGAPGRADALGGDGGAPPVWTLTLVDRADARPLEGVRVEIRTQGETHALATDALGRIQLPGAGGTWSIEAQQEGYAPLRARLERSAAVQGEFILSQVELTEVGGVVLRPDGSGADGAWLLVELPSWDGVNGWIDERPLERSAVADGLGRFTLSVPDDPAALRLFALHPHHPPFELEDVDPPTWRALREERAELRFTPGTTIVGTVRDDQGRPVEGAKVRQRASYGEAGARESLRVAETDGAGAFRLAHDEGGAPWLAIRAQGLGEERVALPRELVREHRIDVVLSPSTELVVECYDATGAPIAGVLVEIEPWTERTREEWEQRTDAEGRAVFAHLPPGKVDISIKTGTYLRPESRQADPREGPQVYTLRLPVRFVGRLERPEEGELRTYLLTRRRDRQGREELERRPFEVIVGDDGRYDSGHVPPQSKEIALGFEIPGHAPVETPFFANHAGTVEFDVRIE